MKKSELRKIIKEVISEQGQYNQGCAPGPNCVAPTLDIANGTLTVGGLTHIDSATRVMCPNGFVLQTGNSILQMSAPSDGFVMGRCVPDLGAPGDMAGHGSTDNPFVPGMGFEDQFIDQITGPGGPFGGPKGGEKGKPIRESKKRRK